MGWEGVTVMDQRVLFIAEYLKGCFLFRKFEDHGQCRQSCPASLRSSGPVPDCGKSRFNRIGRPDFVLYLASLQTSTVTPDRALGYRPAGPRDGYPPQRLFGPAPKKLYTP
jgi:hypothetical protein